MIALFAISGLPCLGQNVTTAPRCNEITFHQAPPPRPHCPMLPPRDPVYMPPQGIKVNYSQKGERIRRF